MRRLLAIALPAVLLVCSAAAAKEITGAAVCGADGCRSIDGAGHSMLEGGPPTGAPSQSEPFVRIAFQIGDGSGYSERLSNIFLPRSGLLLADDGTTWMRPTELAAMREHARRVTPFAADSLPASAPLAPRTSAPAPVSAGDGIEAWWPVLPAAVLVLAVGAALARRARSDGATGATA